MKYLVIIIALASLHTPSYAQMGMWDTYMARFGDKPGSVLLDMDLINIAPDRRFPYLVITGPIAHKCDKQGLPDKDEITILEDILESTGSFLTGITSKVLAGTLTYNCERVNYYYVKDTATIRTAIRRMYDRNYKNYEYAINIKSDPEWKSYRNFLYPDEATQNWMENDKIITKMLKDGDSLKKPHDISFDLYFNSDTARSSFEAFATTKGYNIVRRTESKNEPRAYAIIVSRNSPLTLDTVNKMTAELKEETKMLKGYYTGWTATPAMPGK